MLFPRVLFSVAAFALVTSTTGCSSCGKGTSGPAATREDISIMPKETSFVLMANLARMRDTPLWKRLLAVRDETPDQKQKYDDFVKRTGLDPFKQLDSAFAGFPTNKGSSEFAMLLRGGPFDEARLIAYFTEQAKKDGSDLTSSVYLGHKLYTDKTGATFAVFLDAKTVGIGGKEWIKKVIDLHAKEGESAAKNVALAALIKKTSTADSFWGAGIVPQETRDQLKDDSRLAAAATLQDVYGSIDVKNGLSIRAAADLAGEAQATEVSKKVNDQLAEAKKSPQIQMMGMTKYVDAVKATAQGSAFHLELKLTQPQVEELITQLQGLFKTFGGALGNSMGGGGGGASPTDPPMDVPPAPMAPPN